MAFLNKLPERVLRVRRGTQAALRALIQADPTLAVNEASYKPRDIEDNGKLNSSEFTYEQQALYMVLRSVYAQVTEIDATRRRHETIINESFTKSRSTILKAINDLRSFAFLQQFPEYDDVKFVDFNAARNLSERGPLADVDTESRFVRLAVSSRTEARVNRPNVTPKIEISHFGGGISQSMIQDFYPARMLDGDTTTYWADLLVADGPIEQEYVDSRNRSRRFFGLVSEVKIHLSEATRINILRLLPFGEYPIKVVDIAYKESESSEQWRPLPDFVEGDAGLDWIEVTFKAIQASVIRITLYQKNYVHGIYHLPESMVHNTNLLEHAIADSYRDRVGVSAISDTDVGQVAAFPELLGLLEGLGEFDAEVLRSNLPEERVREHELTEGTLRAMAKVLSRPDVSIARDMLEPIGVNLEEKEEELLEKETTEYLVGIRDLTISYQTYAPVSYYASPKFTASRTPVEVSLVANEIHPAMSDGTGRYRVTGIDYDIDFGEGLRFPLHPKNMPFVEDEFVYIDRHTRVGYTRFLPDSVAIIVRRNGVRVPTSDYSFTIDTSLDLGKITISGNFASTAIYTATYAPSLESSRIEIPTEINSSPIRIPESFEGTDESNRVVSTYIPYIAWTIINDEDNFEKRTGEGVWEYIGTGSMEVDGVTYSTDNILYEPIEVLVNNIKATNITDYDSSIQPAFTEVDPANLLYQYFHVGNYFYFNAPISKVQISIRYNWMVQYIQMIATMRSFKQAGVDVTPKITDYRLQIRTSPL